MSQKKIELNNINNLDYTNFADIEKARLELKKNDHNLEPGEENFTLRQEGILQKVLIANRGEIAKRFILALQEEGIQSIAVVADEDRGQSWFEFANKVIYIGEARNYANIPVICAAILESGANAVYPGYGFLSENFLFVERLLEIEKFYNRKIIFMGPRSSVMRKVGNKLDARRLALENGIPLFLGSGSIQSLEEAKREATQIGFPVILKLDAGGGGKGMLVVRSVDELEPAIESAKRIGLNSYENDTFYLEKFIEKPAHFEVQIFNGVAIGIRKCAVQRRNQKIIEESGESFLDDHVQLQLLSNAEKFSEISGYSEGCGAGTVEFLLDRNSGQFGFLEMNTRLQVEYTVTDQSLGIDLAKWQIFLFDQRQNEIQYDTVKRKRFGDRNHSIQCRIYAEDPFQNYSPSPGKIKELELPTFNGIRCDFGFKSGDRIPGDFDPMVGKLISFGRNRNEALQRMERALSELFVRGITTNIEQLLMIMRHSLFRDGDYDNRLLDDNKELTTPNSYCLEEAIVYACLGETIRQSGENVSETFRERDLAKILYLNESFNSPLQFKILSQEGSHCLRVLRTGLGEFWVSGNTISTKKIHVTRYTADGNRFLAESDNKSISVRIDVKPSFHLIRFTSKFDGKLHYARIQLQFEKGNNSVNESGFLRSPFQGTFVKLFNDPKTDMPLEVGKAITKDQPLLMISAMKMETVLKSPVDGILEYVIEDGNLNKLVRGKTASGQILGKSFAEGEILVRINPNESIESKDEKHDLKNGFNEELNEFSILNYWNLIPTKKDMNTVFKFENKFSSVESRNEILRLLYSWVLGFTQGKDSHSRINYLVQHINIEMILNSPEETKHWKSFIKFFIKFHVLLRSLFSSEIGSVHSHFGEMQRSLLHWDTEGFIQNKSTSRLLTKVFHHYGVKAWTTFRRRPDQGEAFYYLVSAYKTQKEERELFAKVLEKLSPLVPQLKSAALNLRVLLYFEEREQEPKLETIIRSILGRRRNFSFEIPEGMKTLSSRHSESFIRFKKDPWSLFVNSNLEKSKFLNLMNKDDLDIESNLPSQVQYLIKKKLNYWEEKGKVRRLYSPTSNQILFQLQENKKTTYLLFVVMDADFLIPKLDKDGKLHCPELEIFAILGASLLQGANDCQHADSLRLEVIAYNKEGSNCDVQNLDKTKEYEKLFNSAHSILEFFFHASFSSLTLDIERKTTQRTFFQTYSFFVRDGKLRVDTIGECDIKFPYTKELEKSDSKLYEKGKWPVERWVEETFDSFSYEEILIPGLDYIYENSDIQNKIFQKVGAKIYFGKLAGTEALFFLKDSRIAGGATGDKEGKKYLAAAYIAYRKDVPLYVWNDGAGANIKEGMVALNRASEGFFITALLTHRVNSQEFRSAIESHNDSIISDFLFKLENIPNLDFRSYEPDEKPNKCFVVAVGIGSSTGLDVYGSSQASIQVILDEEQSYRVLTGSSVIESVTGESLTNYEIGGARVMGHGTGTVDFVANDKPHLISLLYRLQSILLNRKKSTSLPMFQGEKEVGSKNIFSEKKIEQMADSGEFLAIKGNYSGSESLVSGLFSLAGNPIITIGPRTEFGFHSIQALVKAKESVRMAQKINSSLMLVYGPKWFRSNFAENNISLRVRRDFQKQLQNFNRPLIHIVKHREGLALPELSSIGDVWIWIHSEDEVDVKSSSSQISNPEYCATMTVRSEEEAFLKASQIFNLLNIRELKNSSRRHSYPQIPIDPTVAYDMEKQVIREILDDLTFIEFYKDDPGKSLITGLGRIEGKTVGVIADQPKDGGAPDAQGTEKFRIFMEFLNKHGIPVLMVSDSPGFVPGTKQERLRIQQIGGESLDVNVLSKIPVVSIVLRQNYGGRQIHAFSGFLRPGISYQAWEDGTLAVMGAHSAFDLFQGAKVTLLRKENKENEIDVLRKDFLDSYKEKSKAKEDALSTGVLDGVFESFGDLRSVVLKGLTSAEDKQKLWLGKSKNESHLSFECGIKKG
ncbi:carboxyl transferase domain-containing protein [Leptospira sp. 96542]|nr:carboxyl transferase domain-containing protein [Leptospira sp. 96542]